MVEEEINSMMWSVPKIFIEIKPKQIKDKYFEKN